MSVLVYSGSVLVEEINCLDEDRAIEMASYWQDEGYRVRVIGNVQD